jgi:hypothetical protein
MYVKSTFKLINMLNNHLPHNYANEKERKRKGEIRISSYLHFEAP